MDALRVDRVREELMVVSIGGEFLLRAEEVDIVLYQPEFFELTNEPEPKHL